MPRAWKRARVRRRWLRAALSFRSCVTVSCARMRSADFREQRPARAHKGASIAVAVRTWQTVRPGFFPPMLPAELAEKDVAQTTEDQVPLDRDELAHLEVIHSQFRLAVLEGSLNGETGVTPTHFTFVLGAGRLRRCLMRITTEETSKRIANGLLAIRWYRKETGGQNRGSGIHSSHSV
jgi:hypothetical protein